MLGKPVGKQDEFAAAFGGLNFITFHKDGSTNVEPLRLEPAVNNGASAEADVVLYRCGAPLMVNPEGAGGLVQEKVWRGG